MALLGLKSKLTSKGTCSVNVLPKGAGKFTASPFKVVLRIILSKSFGSSVILKNACTENIPFSTEKTGKLNLLFKDSTVKSPSIIMFVNGLGVLMDWILIFTG